MSDKERRSYKEIVASFETHIIYINNHLQNIDTHLERLNMTVNDNKTRSKINKWAIGGIVTWLTAITSKYLGWW